MHMLVEILKLKYLASAEPGDVDNQEYYSQWQMIQDTLAWTAFLPVAQQYRHRSSFSLSCMIVHNPRLKDIEGMWPQ